jgi:hypothetical protein|tara:strand:- start:4533 stop:4715 length:183 start_codon:yes stop_codon:yes gene_type:complete
MAIKVNQFKIEAKVNERDENAEKVNDDKNENSGDKIDEEALTINIYERVIRYLEREKIRF